MYNNSTESWSTMETNDSLCIIGVCQYLNLTTCTELNFQEYENETVEDIPSDEDGCFSTNWLRSTLAYKRYTEVKGKRATNGPSACWAAPCFFLTMFPEKNDKLWLW